MFNKGLRPHTGRFFMVFGFALVTGCGMLWGQKVTQRSFDASALTNVQIDAERIFQVELIGERTETVRTEVFIEGEYQSELTVSSGVVGSTLFLKGVFMPSFVDPNDKLSAHKVVSVRLKVYLPESLETEVSGSATRVLAGGFFDDLTIITAKGPVFLNAASGLISVRTTTGEIIAENIRGALSATSTYGQVYRNEVPRGNATLRLESVSGDIYINKEE